jgi:hypothetical protein
MDTKVKTLICCCCGMSTKGRQWWNRDTGYGICGSCVGEEKKRNDAIGIKASYGEKNVHYFEQEGE